MVRSVARSQRRGCRGNRKPYAACARARSACRLAVRSGMARRARLPMHSHCEPARGSGNGFPHSYRKERTKRMSWNAFTALVRRDLRLFFLDKRALTMSFVAPIVIGSFFGYLFGSAADRPPSKIRVAIVDQDASPVSRKITDAIAKDAAIEVQPPLPLPDVEERVRGGKITVAAVIPK